jgi:hypothetical protein|tara:strand:+ start:25735 stop:26460 length:726 start_codon:yes stop_codon:yes gene_type:complete
LTIYKETVLSNDDAFKAPVSLGNSHKYMLNLLQSKAKKSAIPLNGYKEIVRFLISRFNNLPFLNESNETVLAKCRYGNPERTIAKLKDHDNIIVPLLTISQNNVVEAPTRQRYFSVLQYRSYWDDEKRRAMRIVSLADRPVTIQYNINIWTKYMEDMDQLSQQVRAEFNPSIQLNTNFSKDSKVFLSAETNNYSFSVADKEDRIIRKTFVVSVETYIKNPDYLITSSGKIEEFNLDTELSK